MSRATNQQIGQGFANLFQGIAQGQAKRQTKEAAQVILEDPKATPVQKALAWESIAEGSGPKAYDSILKDQALQKNEETRGNINSQLNGVQQNVGERAQVGSINPNVSPVEAANQMLSPQQIQENEYFPPFGQEPQQFSNAPMTPAMQAMAETQQQQAQQNVPQGTQQQQAPPPAAGIESIPTTQLQKLLQDADNADDKGAVKRIGAELKRRDVETKANATKDAAEIQADAKVRIHNQDQVLAIQQESEKTIENTSKVIKAFDDQKAVVQKTGVFSRANFAKTLINNGYELLGNAIQSGEGALFTSAGKEVVGGGLKEAFGAKPLGVEFDAFMNSLAQPGRDPKYNELVIDSLSLPYEIKNQISRFKMDLIAQNPSISPIILNSEAYKFGEQYRDQATEAWKQKVRDTLSPEIKQKATNATLEDIFK